MYNLAELVFYLYYYTPERNSNITAALTFLVLILISYGYHLLIMITF